MRHQTKRKMGCLTRRRKRSRGNFLLWEMRLLLLLSMFIDSRYSLTHSLSLAVIDWCNRFEAKSTHIDWSIEWHKLWKRLRKHEQRLPLSPSSSATSPYGHTRDGQSKRWATFHTFSFIGWSIEQHTRSNEYTYARFRRRVSTLAREVLQWVPNWFNSFSSHYV